MLLEVIKMSKVKFSDVVVRANTKEDRHNTDLEFYVGGEHIDTDEVVIEKRGLIAGSTIGPMFYFGFKAGQVLFVSRNPHLRKAGMVTFDGICSEKTFVLETKDESVLLQRYLPFILQSDHFWSYAEAHKSGSVNFFTNWSTLAEYEFDLPSIHKQQELANILWAMTDARMAYKRQIYATDELVKSRFLEIFGNPVSNEMRWPSKPLKDVAPEVSPALPVEEKYWWLNLDMIETYSGAIINKIYATTEEIGNSTSTFDNTMVLYSKLRPYLNKVVVPDGYGYATTELVGMRPNIKVLNKYFLFNILRGDDFVDYANGISGGSQMPRMPIKNLRTFQCILPPMELQEEFVSFSAMCDRSKAEIETSMKKLTVAYKSVLAENFA